jgi:DNA polymerase-3 subunit alpha
VTSDYFPVHAHTQFSGMDGMDKADDHVARVAELGQPAISFTEHGNMASAVQGYKAAKKHGIAFFPGSEFYVVRDVNDDATKTNRTHLGMLALDAKGYEALTKLSTLSWQEDRFYYKPLIDLSDLAFLHEQGFSDHIAVTSGCYSSMTVQQFLQDGVDGAMNILRMLGSWFPNTLYVELQDHGIKWAEHNGIKDKDIADGLYVAAKQLGLPVVFGGDSHYVHPHEQPVHDLMKDICYFGAGEDIHFNGGPYHLLSTDEARAKMPKKWDAIEEGHADLLDRHELSIPPLDNYKFQVPALYKNADDRLKGMVFEGLRAKGLTSTEYSTQATHELDVIKKMGMSNYFLLVKEHVVGWARENGIIVNCRGSVNGSLACYAIDLTVVDPLKWNTNFERFLSLDRMKPPDIDVDVDFRGRQRVIEHLRAVFPTVTQVGTYAQIGFAKGDEEKGSVVVQYMAAMRKKNYPGFRGRIMNAAGFIIPGDDHPIDKYLPLGRIVSSNTKVTQYTKDDVEALGYLKIDVLGLRALQTLNGTLQLIGRQPNEWDWIPFDDKDACELLRKGKTAGIFQYEGYSSRQGAQEMKIKNTLDCILGLALYRPALMNGGQKDQYLANRGKSKSRQVRLHPLFDPVVDDTAGVPLYQEQIMQMLQVLGMEFKEYNELMTAIKASNGFIAGAAETFKRLMPLFYDLCEDKGLTDEEADDAWHAVIGFTEYGFNRAHSSAYGLMSYWSAYLKAHYPLEYMASLLNVWAEDKDKVREYTAEARRLNFSVVKADVNDSDVSWTIDTSRRNALRKGLVSIDGVGEKAATAIVTEREANGPYTSIQDFIDRLPARAVNGGKDWKKQYTLKGTCLALFNANAFRSVGNA